MNPLRQRIIAGSLLAAIALASFAPAASAGHGNEGHRKYRRYERPVRVQRVNAYPRRVVEYRRYSSGHGSTLAGFLGGVAVGAIISSAAQSRASSHVECAPQPTYCPPPSSRCDYDNDRYSYEDPYCRERFPSLELYLSHARRHHDPELVVRVIDNRDGDCVDMIRFSDERWNSCERNDRGGWDYDDRND